MTAPGYCILHFYVFLYKRVLKHNISEVLVLWADKGLGGAVNGVKQLRNGGCSRSYTHSYKYPSNTSASVFPNDALIERQTDKNRSRIPVGVCISKCAYTVL